MDLEQYYRGKEDREREERDPRKRKRNSDEMAVYDDRQRSRSKERSRRGRSRSRSDSGDRDRYSSSGRRQHYGDREPRDEDWKKQSDAFIHKMSAAPPTDPRLARQQQGYPAYAQPGAAPGYHHPVPPPGYPPQYPPQAAGYHQGYPQPDQPQPDMKVKKEWDERMVKDERKRREEDSDDGDRKPKPAAIMTPAEREKVLTERVQYETAAEKLEEQLLKLKEQRETLKTQGKKHEDSIMKENAKLQKEVKYRIQYMREAMEKADKDLEADAKAVAESKEREKVKREQERALREQVIRNEERRGRDSSRDSSEEKERKKRKKKKSRSSSSSSEDERKKRKKKKKGRGRSGSSDSSDSDGGHKKMDDELFRMVAELTSKKKRSSGGDENVLMDLMTKMSESYSKIKKENSEISARCVILENQNKVLKRQVEDLQEKQETGTNDGRESRGDSRREKKRYESESSEKADYRNSAAPLPVPAPVPSPMPPPGGWSHEPADRQYKDERYEERDKNRDERYEERDKYHRDDRHHREERYGREDRHGGREERFKDDRGDRYSSRDERRDRDKYRDRDRRRDRSRSKSRDRGSRHSEDRGRDRGRDKNDKIDLKDWTQPPEQQAIDPSLLSLKEKMRAKEEEARREDELRNRWVTKEIEPAPVPEPVKPQEQPLPENRSSIKMSWGQGTRKTPDPGPPAKKNSSAVVGRMPWVKNGDSDQSVNGNEAAPRRSKFGPPVSAAGAIPPPSLVTQAPTLANDRPVEAGAGSGNFPPPPPPMLAPPAAAAHQQQQPGWGAPQQHQPGPGMDNGGGWYGYGGGMQPPPQEMPQPQEAAAPPKVVRNPKPQPMDMHAMIAAAQQHMQKNLTAKLATIGVPLTSFGISTPQSTEADSIPLPEEPIGVDNIANTDIPLPDLPGVPGGADEDRPPGDDDCAPPGCD